MSPDDRLPGYVIRPEYLRLAGEKAAAEQKEVLDDIAALVSALDALERTFGERLQAARAREGISQPALSRPAGNWTTASHDADREFHRLLLRRCRRAETAEEVIRELIDAAREDLALTEFRMNGTEDEPARRLVGEILTSKKTILECLARSFPFLG